MRPTKNRFFLIIILIFGTVTLLSCNLLQAGKNSVESNLQPIAPSVLTSSQTPVESSEQSPPTNPESEPEINCAGEDTQEVVESIADTYGVSPQQIRDWNCQGHSFEDILIALETGLAMDIPAEDLLKMHLKQDWESIWKEIGFTNGL